MKLLAILSVSIICSQIIACGGGAGATQTSNTQTAPNIALTQQSTVKAEAPSELTEARAKWQAAQVTNYHFEYKEGGGYKFAVYPFKLVKVVANQVVEVDGAAVDTHDAVSQRLTVDNLLEQLDLSYSSRQTTNGQQDRVVVSFDEVLGFPLSIVTSSSQCCDQDHEVAIQNFTIDP